MTHVFIVQHVHEFESGEEDVKFIGAFTSKVKADRAVKKLMAAPGFKEHPDGFSIDRYELDRAWWTEGFVSWDEALEPQDSQKSS